MSAPLLLLGVCAAFVLSAGLTLLSLASARHFGLIDQLGEDRRLHTSPTPRGGGLGIAVVMVFALLLWPATANEMWALPCGLALIALIGGLDDVRALAPLPKLAGQLLGAGLIALAVPVLGLSAWAGVLVALLAIVALVNVWNFMDGSDGLAASQATLIALTLGLVAELPLMLMLAAACAGFLPFNLVRARIFLGDIGSHALGAAIALGLLLALNSGAIALPQALVLVSAFLLDAGWTLIRRAWRGEAVWRAHSQHLYQTAIRSGRSHGHVCFAYAIWTSAAIALMLAMRQWATATQWLAAFALALLGTFVFFLLPILWQRGADRAGSPSR